MKTIIILLMLSASLLVEAQTISENVEKGAVQSWEIGTDLLWLIDKNQVPANLFVRSNFANKKNKLRAWRLRLGMDLSINDSIQITNPQDNERDLFAPFVRVGYEWQHKVADKATFFYGADASLLYSKEKVIEVKTIGPPPDQLYQESNKTIEFGLIGFVGAKYQATGWLALSIESSLNIIYRIRRDDFKTTNIDFPDDEGVHGFNHVDELNINITPITVINISFNINR